jgi:hypothetical protein
MRGEIMTKKFIKLLVTKLDTSTHEKLKELAILDRRTLSALSRNIIEDYITALEEKGNEEQGIPNFTRVPGGERRIDHD